MLRRSVGGLHPKKMLATLICIVMVIITADAWAQGRGTVTANPAAYGGEFAVAIGKSRILHVSRPYTDLMVGDPAIADVVPLSNTTVYVLGRQIGSTSLVVYGDGRTLISAVDLTVTPDTDTLKHRLHDVLPGDSIEVRSAGGAIILSGTVSNPEHAARAAQLAERFAPGAVTNMLTVHGSQQVLLEVRFAEVQRSLVRDLGINTRVLFNAGGTALNFMSGIPNPAAFAQLIGVGTPGNWNIAAMLDALEQRGLITTLAEPNLVAMSGETASFLAGGEFPVPVAQNTSSGGTSITVEFKQFGVSLAFTPTVVDNRLISLIVAPEVSQIDPDPTHSFKEGDLRIPGLITRRARTTVELHDGQTFAIAGLISSDVTSTRDQMPGFGSIPIIGTLLSSTRFQRHESELVILVTPHLAQPRTETALAMPTDYVVHADDFNLYFLGKLENRLAGAQRQGRGGLDGSVGHMAQ